MMMNQTLSLLSIPMRDYELIPEAPPEINENVIHPHEGL